MAKHVVILGAGASAEVGAPVMSNFLDVAQDLWARDQIGEKKDSFERVFAAISSLQAVHSKSEFDLINIESVFTAFEMAKTLGRFPGQSSRQINKLLDDLKWLIVVTLERTLRFPVSGGQISTHPAYEVLLDIAARVPHRRGKPEVAILTFNYDVAVDLAAIRRGTGIDYGFSKEEGFADCIPILKLHGSLNWTTEKKTKKIVPWFLRQYFSRYSLGHGFSGIKANLPIGSQLPGYGGEGKEKKEPHEVDGLPVIVPPSWNKADSHRAVAKVWARAADELSGAENIYIVGYSLPETDAFFKHLYALGTVGNTLLKRFWVFNPDGEREKIFKSMLGPGARSRFEYFSIGFSEALPKLKRAMSEKD